MKAIYGGKIKNNPTSFGNDIFISNSERPSDYGIEMYQGNKTDLSFNKLTISYLFNPKTNLKIEAGYVYRILVDDFVEDNTSLFLFALKSDLFNRYYDF